ncbi:CASP C terminal-domain-containing protein [Kalaharituber pfeilii]|nr:CASP C terminal-domain-containing protein [Kalaharituber pfeilii]
MTTTGDDARKSLEQKFDAPSGEKARAEGGNAFQRAVAAWRNVDLTSLQKALDSTASEIVNSQRDSLVERKELAQKTKEFRKMDEEGRASEWKGLLKSYQLFIDHLTTQKKATETSFLTIYSALSEAPDPYPLLEATIDSLVSSEDVSRLSSENSSLRATISRLTSQVAHLETRLDEQKREREKKEKERAEDVSKVEGVWKGLLDEKTRNWEAKEKGYIEKIADIEGLVREVKASYEVAQRMGRHDSLGEGKEGGKEDRVGNGLAELEIVGRDLERTNLRLAEVEARNEQLRLELAKAIASPTDATQPTKESQQADEEEEDPHVIRLQNENFALMKKLELAKEQTDNDKREWDRKLKALERMLEEAKGDKEVLKAKVESWRDYEEVKRELEILKSIEFSTGDEDEDEMLDFSKAQTGSRATPASGGKESLEQLLLARNKKLSNELTVLRVSHQDLTSRLEALQKTLETTSAELTQSRQLNAKLEDDLYKLQSETPSHQFSSAMSIAGTRYAPSMSRGGRVSPTSSIISGFSPQVGSRGETLESLRGEPSGVSGGILPMITAQRDRFKQRNAQLEDELSKANNTISSLRQEIATLQKDNLQLYEKTRYISTYSHSRPSVDSYVNIGSGTSAMPGGISSSSVSHSRDGMHDRYRAAYEANISPFQTFRSRETARAMRTMGVAERVIYGFARVVLANRLSRNLFAGYCVLLHLLALGMLYYVGTTGDTPTPLASGAASEGKDWVREGLSVR